MQKQFFVITKYRSCDKSAMICYSNISINFCWSLCLLLAWHQFRVQHFLTILQHLPFDPMGYQEARKGMMKAVSFIRAQISEHRETIGYDNPRDFVDSFLVQSRKSSNSEENPFTGELPCQELADRKMRQFLRKVLGLESTLFALSFNSRLSTIKCCMSNRYF